MLLLTHKRFSLIVAILLAMPFVLRADTPTATEKLVYVKPDGVGEKTRVRGTARGRLGNVPEDLALLILSPEHTGLTVQEHPSIFWFMNEPVKGAKYKISINKDGEAEPLLEKELDAEKDTGIQRLNLKDLSKSLEPNTEYQVVVAIIPDPTQKSRDIVTSAMIKRVPASEKLVSRLLTRPTPGERAAVYAKQGIWYDALAAISDQIAADPGNKALYAQRADLLKQVGLPEAAAYDQLGKSEIRNQKSE